MLAEDSMRAARLVVDTGLHALGWTRQQCVDYLRANTMMSETEIQSETDRYIEVPGAGAGVHGRQAGDPAVARRRRSANSGTDFDIQRVPRRRAGAAAPLPMSVLADVVSAWVATRSAGTTSR